MHEESYCKKSGEKRQEEKDTDTLDYLRMVIDDKHITMFMKDMAWCIWYIETNKFE